MEAERGRVLLALARWAISEDLGLPVGRAPEQPWLREPGATFVTLKCDGALRGCVGSLTAQRPLGEDVVYNARAAAFRDARFEPLTAGEFLQTEVEVSLLSPQEPLAFRSERHLLTQLRPGEDGLVLTFGRRRGTFLPQVWEHLPDPAAFLGQLKQKAGLPSHFWAEEIQVSRYTVTHWREPSAPTP